MSARAKLDLERCDALVRSIVDGTAADWTAFVALLCPAILGYARGSRSLGHRRSDDDCHEILATVLERLRKNEFRALRTYAAWRGVPHNSEKTIEDWLRIVTDRVACDYVTHRVRRTLIHTLGTALDTGTRAELPGTTDAQAVRQLMEHASRELPPEQADLIRRVLDGQATGEIAAARGEKKEDVEKRLRAAYARLRRWADDGENASG